MKVLGLTSKAKSCRTHPDAIRGALKQLGFRMYREVYCDENWSKIPARVQQALLAVNYNDAKNTWHWVVLDRSDPEQPILDPRSQARRQIHVRTRLYSYYRIERA